MELFPFKFHSLASLGRGPDRTVRPLGTGNLDCRLVVLPDLSLSDRLIHIFLNLRIPLTGFPVAPLVSLAAALVTSILAYKIQRRNREGGRSVPLWV